MRSTTWLHCLLRFSAMAMTSMAHHSAQSVLNVAPDWDVLSFSHEWQTLGPFQIGTREFAWGVDPLELYGGFRSLSYDPSASFSSSLAPNGTIQWSKTAVKLDPESGSVQGVFEFPNVDWSNLQRTLGWSVLQYQAWTRGNFRVAGNSTQRFIFDVSGVFEYFVDDVLYYGGDLYFMQTAAVTIDLSPGLHRIDVRLVRDIRSMGGELPPTIAVRLEVHPARDNLRHVEKGFLLPDIVDGNFISTLGSIVLHNAGTEVLNVEELDGADVPIQLATKAPIRLLPAQIRPIPFRLLRRHFSSDMVHIEIRYTYENGSCASTAISQAVVHTNFRDTQKITFWHPGHVVSYAMLHPPPLNQTDQIVNSAQDLPILVKLHGAGWESDSYPGRHSLDPLADLPAWTLFPSGVTPWSSDDWHVWGWADVEAALSAISDWIKHTEWSGPGADIDRLFVIGHSNGGQGVWYALANHGDRIMAAAAVSGYLSIQSYVPYTLCQEIDPALEAIRQASISPYRPELLVPTNAKTIPVAQQHGNMDDNVPVHQSRRMHFLAAQSGWQTNYTERKGEGHYYDGVLTTDTLRAFYSEQLAKTQWPPPVPSEFEIHVAHPSHTKARFGIRIVELVTPGILGRLTCEQTSKRVKLKTSNTARIVLEHDRYCGRLIEINGNNLDAPACAVESAGLIVLTWRGGWTISASSNEHSGSITEPLVPLQGSGLDAIMRSQGTFVILYHSHQNYDLALQISRNLMQYYGADAVIFEASEAPKDYDDSWGNVIEVGSVDGVSSSLEPDFAIQLTAKSISVEVEGLTLPYHSKDESLGAIFLHPFRDGCLRLVVTGSDQMGVVRAARLVPLLTGTGQPDFIILGEETAWNGVGGVKAMGFFDHAWNVTRTSYWR